MTTCAVKRGSVFGRGMGESITLNAIGRIVHDTWYALPEHFPHVILDAFVVMADHVHGVIMFADVPPTVHAPIGRNGADNVGAQLAAPLRYRPSAPRVVPGSLGAIVRAFKSAATRAINLHRNTPGALVWQRNYYEHIVRDDGDLDRIRRYIAANPARWCK